ncbi:Calx-beta domain-containing protein [Novosphingobium mangrovi (ex Huang et al. 2023)]|uniref:Calx-beta domain-containing protein n=1 Tax=Novosphingobium mangrovi (ex Huang et al. 2023) TaxID=2976432 RepID=A0ABT2I488_9SPHN|nr:Calx-beta domain-containing protein [Novosphingobium mangrovi (ex Huang et al. 2023)]MCT2399614.1 hypothetical protein [Novosphingobium mangrovi (ex Huang et al. 2023)]
MTVSVLCVGSANAQESYTYSYDAQGRLVRSSRAGGPSSGEARSISYDDANNRTNYTVAEPIAAPSVSIGNASTIEGGKLVFPVNLSGTSASTISVNYATAGGSATSGNDFTAATGTLTIPAGQTSGTINVSTTNDKVVETSETMTVTISSPSGGATLGTATGTGTISDNDSSLVIGNASVTEGGTLSFTVTRSGDITRSVSASYATANGSAVAGSDYTAKSGTVSFAVNQTSATISIATVNDLAVESTETMSVTLSNPSTYATITTATGTGSINDDDIAFANLAIGNAAAVTEGGTLAFTVTRSGNTTSAVSVGYATANGTATAGSDYTAKSGTLNFAANQTSATINVATIDDTSVESAETMSVSLSNPSTYASVTTATGAGTINDNDVVTGPSISINDASATEASNLVFTVTLSATSSSSISVNYATATGTAAANDFTATSGTLTFSPGQISKTISVPTHDDNRVETDEYMYVNLSGATNGSVISDGQGRGTIQDNGLGGGCKIC